MGGQDDGTTAGLSFSTTSYVASTTLRPAPTPLPTLTILGHPDLARVGDRVHLGELVSGQVALLSRLRPRFVAPGGHRGLPLNDRFLSRQPLRLQPLRGDDLLLDTASCRARVVVDGTPVVGRRTLPLQALDDGVVLELGRRVVLLLHRYHPPARVAGERRALEGSAAQGRFGLVGASDVMERVYEAIARVGGLDVPILLRGETGTGKELVARALHDSSPRRSGPFVSVDLGALTESLAGAELFGAIRGAYTGAVRDQPGYFGRAHGGTLFLDEIGEAPLEVQVKMLRALETGEIVAVGSQTPRPVDARIVSATDANLDRLIADHRFREPLLHRLAGYVIRLPPLRRRRDDIARLFVFFLHQELEQTGGPRPAGTPEARRRRGFDEPMPAALVRRLVLYDWPGNVRELRNVVRHLVIDSRGQPSLDVGLRLDELLPPAGATPTAALDPMPWWTGDTPRSGATAAPPRRRKPAEVSEDELVEALRDHRWVLKDAAEALGIPRTSIYALIERSSRVRTAADIPFEEIRTAWRRYRGDIPRMAEKLEISERALRQRLKDLGLR